MVLETSVVVDGLQFIEGPSRIEAVRVSVPGVGLP
jgi:hypothetical protein